MNKEFGDIYRILNTVNSKSYIGQAKHFSRHGNNKDGTVKYERRGWKVRIHEHFYRIFHDRKRACPKLANAVKKYGQDAFVAFRIETCTLVDLDDREAWWIRIFNSFNEGYNASPGGGQYVLDHDRISVTKQMKWFDPDVRERRLEKRAHKLPSNIDAYTVNNEHVGYRVYIIRRSKRFAKVYGPGYNISLEEKLMLAIQWRDDVMKYMDQIQHLPLEEFISKIKEWNDIHHKYTNDNPNGVVKYRVLNEKEGPKIMKGRDRTNGLPVYVYELKKNGTHTGYQSMFTHNGKRYSKTFGSTKLPMEEKIRLCIQWRDQKLNELSNNL